MSKTSRGEEDLEFWRRMTVKMAHLDGDGEAVKGCLFSQCTAVGEKQHCKWTPDYDYFSGCNGGERIPLGFSSGSRECCLFWTSSNSEVF